MTIQLKIHSTGTGLCALSGKEGEGIVVSFDDGTLREGFLSHRAFQQLIKMKLAQPQADKPTGRVAIATPAQPAGNGAAAPVGAK